MRKTEKSTFVGTRLQNRSLQHPPCIGALLGESMIYLREEVEGVQEGAVEEEARMRTGRKRKKRRE